MSKEERFRQELERLDSAVEYFKKKGLVIEVCGGVKGDSLIIDFMIGELNFPDSLIATGVSNFAVIPEEQFEKLEKSGIITDVADRKFLDPYSGHSLPGKVGKTNIEVKGIMGRKKYQDVSVVGVKFHPKYKWGSILGKEFAFSFDETEMGWPGDPVIGFYGCRKIKP